MVFSEKRKAWNKGLHKRLNTGRTHFKKGFIPWNKGISCREDTKLKLRELQKKNPSKGFLGKKHIQEVKEKIRKIHLGNKYNLGKKRSIESRQKMRESHLGKKLSVETRKRMSLIHRGEKAPNWRGGITEINQIIRTSLEYRLWRESIFQRDNYTCRFCGKRGGNLEADHIKPFSLFPELRFAIDNGRTLCRECHKKTNTYGWKIIYAI